MITYESTNSNLFTVLFTDRITFNDIKEFLHTFKQLEGLPKKICLLYNMVDANLDLTIDEIQDVSMLAELATTNYQSVRTAFLVDKPKEAAYIMLFTEFVGNSRTERKIFSTLAAAIAWLGN